MGAERWDIGGENKSAPAAIPKAASPFLATFTLIPVCAKTGQVEIEFDKREIDSQASDAGVIKLVWGGMRPMLRGMQ